MIPKDLNVSLITFKINKIRKKLSSLLDITVFIKLCISLIKIKKCIKADTIKPTETLTHKLIMQKINKRIITIALFFLIIGLSNNEMNIKKFKGI